MKFSEAMECLERGKKVRCVKWNKDDYLDRDKLYYVSENPEHWMINKYFTSEWEVYEEPEKTYTFMEILFGLKEGKKYKRQKWIAGIYISASGYFRYDSCPYESVEFTYEDFLGNDWIEVK